MNLLATYEFCRDASFDSSLNCVRWLPNPLEPTWEGRDDSRLESDGLVRKVESSERRLETSMERRPTFVRLDSRYSLKECYRNRRSWTVRKGNKLVKGGKGRQPTKFDSIRQIVQDIKTRHKRLATVPFEKQMPYWALSVDEGERWR